MVQLEIAEVDEFTTIAARDIPRPFDFVRNRRRFWHQLPAVYQCCFLVCHAHSSLQPLHFHSRFVSFFLFLLGTSRLISCVSYQGIAFAMPTCSGLSRPKGGWRPPYPVRAG